MGRRPVTRRIAGVVVVGLLLVLVAGCHDRSRVDPNATVTIRGSVLDAGGAPLADRPVHLGAGITDSEVGLAIFTVGLSCTAGGCRGKQVDTKTDEAGSYAFTLKGKDTQSTFGEAVSELVTASAAPAAGQVSGASVSARFKVQSPDVALPTLHLVDPSLAFDPAATPRTASWAAAAPGPYDLTFEDGTAAPVWKVTTSALSAAVDPRVLEGGTGRVVVAGGSHDQVTGSAVDIRWRSAGVGYAGVGVPPSRGAACAYATAAGAAGSPSSPCGLTDGDLSTLAPPPAVCAATTSSACPPPSSVDITLAEPVPAELVVVRGCPGACPVSTSADGQTFAVAGTATGDDATVALDGSSIRAVRLGFDGTAPPSLREVSVWGAVPSPSPHAAPTDVGGLRARFGLGGGGGSVPAPLAVLAAILAAVVLVAAGFTLGRRTRSGGRGAP